MNKKNSKSGKQSQDLQRFVKPGVNIQDVQKLKDCFDIFDYDKSGSVSPQQLKNAIIALGMQSQAQKILGLVQNYTKNSSSDQIDFDGFMDLFGFNSDLKNQNSQQNIFNQFDQQGKGYVTFQDFQRVSSMLGQRYSESQLQQMVQHACKEKDGKLTYDDFITVLTKDYPKI